MTTASTRSQSSSAASEGVRSTATITKLAGQARQRRRVARPAQVELDAAQHVVEVGAALAQVGVAEARRTAAWSWSATVRSAHSALTRSLADDAHRPVEQQRVVEHQQVGVEDVGVGRPHLAGQPVLDGLELLARGLDGARPAAGPPPPPPPAATVSRKTGMASRSTTRAGPTAMPGETPMPLQLHHVSSPKPAATRASRASRAAPSSSPSAVTVRRAPLGGGQEQDAQDRLPVHRPPVPRHRDARAEAVRGVDEAGGRPRVEAQPVHDPDLARDHACFFSRISLAT